MTLTSSGPSSTAQRLAATVLAFAATAAIAAPPRPAALQALEKKGVTVVGTFPAPGGLTAWAGYVGQHPVALYVTPDGKNVIAGTLYDAPEGRTGAEIDKVSARPDFLVMIFPVVTMEEPYVHKASRTALLGANPSEELKKHLSVELQVTKDTPPTFLVHSTADTTVPVENSLLFFQAMRNAKAPIEMHLYPRGPHGDGMSPALGPISEWPKHCEDWMRFNGWLPK